MVKGDVKLNSALEFDNCDIKFKKAEITIYRSSKLKITNSFVLLHKVMISGKNTIGDDIQIINSEVDIRNCVFNELNRIEICNQSEEEKKVEVTKCVFSDFKQFILIENASEEYVVIDNCVLSDFPEGGMYLKCKYCFVQKSVFSDCKTGLSALLKNNDYSIAVSNCTFSDIKESGIELWMHSDRSKMVINDVTCSDCEIGVHAKIKQGIKLKKISGEIDVKETVMIDNFHGSNNIQWDIKIDELKEEESQH